LALEACCCLESLFAGASGFGAEHDAKPPSNAAVVVSVKQTPLFISVLPFKVL